MAHREGVPRMGPKTRSFPRFLVFWVALGFSAAWQKRFGGSGTITRSLALPGRAAFEAAAILPTVDGRCP